MFHLCYAVLSVSYSFVITCWERAALLALLFVMFSCVFVTFPYDVPGHMWYLVVSIPESLPSYLACCVQKNTLISVLVMLYFNSLSGVPGQVRYLIVLIPILCLYFVECITTL